MIRRRLVGDVDAKQLINITYCTLLVMLTIDLFLVALGFCLMRLVVVAPP